MTNQPDTSVRVYSDNAITGEIIRVIDTAEARVALVSPFIDKVLHIEQAVDRAIKNEVVVTVFTRKEGTKLGGGNKAKSAIAWYRKKGIEVVGVPNLHAKFYINENEAVLTSMNLIKSSWANSLEVGITVDGRDHQKLSDYLLETIRPWSGTESSSPVKTKTKSRASDKGKSKSRMAVSQKQADEGFCIRCGDPLTKAQVKSGKTMCRKDYVAWAKAGDEDFSEKFCTTCGEPHQTTFSKPQCWDCWKRRPLESSA